MLYFKLISCIRSDKQPPIKKECSEERDKVTAKTPVSNKKIKKEKSTPESVDSKISKVSSKKKASPPKSPTKKSPSKKSPSKAGDVRSFFKAETSTKADDEPKSVKKEEEKSDGDEKVVSTPPKSEKPVNPFFMKVQSAGAGLKGADYNPDKTKYHPINDAFWKHGEK